MQQISRVADGIVLVVADDSDIFVLLLHFCHQGRISCKVLMVSPIQGRSILHFTSAAEEHSSIVPDLLAVYAVTWCDTVTSYFGVGKGGAMKCLRHCQLSLSLLGNTDGLLFSEVVDQATRPFVVACYDQHRCRSLMEAPQQMWFSKVRRTKTSTP